MIKKLLLSLFALVATASVVAIAQQWPNLPIVGDVSYCSSTVNNTCVNTVPAGPALTGNETIPADTNISGGATPQTVKMHIQSIGGGVFTVTTPLSGDTITLTKVTRQLVITPAGTIGALTVVMPAATTLIHGQRLGLCTTQIVTALTVTAGAGTTVSNAPTALLVPVNTGAGSCVEWAYNRTSASAGVWYRVQ